MENINKVIHRADTRGHAAEGWLESFHTFSFANYYDPQRLRFGTLRVLNDDIIEAGMGFGMHPHDNMEIITIPLEGDLEHRDSMGNTSVIKYGDVQVMSAGTGVFHSEYNKNGDRPVKLLQIWVFPNKRGVTPRYGQLSLNIEDRVNKFQQILSPDVNDEGLWIHQDAWFSIGRFDNEKEFGYKLKRENNGIYIFIIDGEVEVNGEKLGKRDGMGISGVDELNFRTLAKSEILIMEIPMTI